MTLEAELKGRRFFCSWSGGKDAYLALQRAAAAAGRPAALLTMLHEEGAVSRGHGLPLSVLQAQAAALGLPLVTRNTSWDEYEGHFVGALDELRDMGIEDGVFGDIDLQGHRDWVEAVCRGAGLACHLPLWSEPREVLVRELIASNVIAAVVAVDAARLGEEMLGRRLDDGLVADLLAAGVDVCGENGEYHTAVIDAPLFTRPVPLMWQGHEERDGHWLLRFTAAFDDHRGGT